MKSRGVGSMPNSTFCSSIVQIWEIHLKACMHGYAAHGALNTEVYWKRSPCTVFCALGVYALLRVCSLYSDVNNQEPILLFFSLVLLWILSKESNHLLISRVMLWKRQDANDLCGIMTQGLRLFSIAHTRKRKFNAVSGISGLIWNLI